MFDNSIKKVDGAEALVMSLGLNNLELYALGVRLSGQERL